MKQKKQKVLLMALYHGENMAVRLLQPLVKARGHHCDILFFKSMQKQLLKDSLINQAFNAHYSYELPSEADYEKLRESKFPLSTGIAILRIPRIIGVLKTILRHLNRSMRSALKDSMVFSGLM